jgi:hypothetical protein
MQSHLHPAEKSFDIALIGEILTVIALQQFRGDSSGLPMAASGGNISPARPVIGCHQADVGSCLSLSLFRILIARRRDRAFLWCLT